MVAGDTHEKRPHRVHLLGTGEGGIEASSSIAGSQVTTDRRRPGTAILSSEMEEEEVIVDDSLTSSALKPIKLPRRLLVGCDRSL